MKNIKNFNTLSENYRIVIPQIQRDYVQGSDKHKEKRDKFIDALIKHLEMGEILHLDFIYGGCDEDAQIFYPLDGQQRLTTLYLLRWIIEVLIGRRKNITDRSQGNDELSYQSRRSSDLFCHKLSTDNFVDNFNGKESVSKYIEGEKLWYVSDWNFDSTIRAMLEMLDVTKEKLARFSLEQLEDMYRKFNYITFDVLNLKDYDLTDTLYIKMNERGKQLTEFENWKASFIRFLEEKHRDEYLKRFEHSIEHEWTDLIWPYALGRWEKLTDEEEKQNKYPMIDNDFINLLSFVHETYFFAINPKIGERDVQTGDFHNTLASMEDIFSDEDNLLFLFDFLDVWYKIQEREKIDDFFKKLLGENAITLWDNNDKSNLFVECIDKGLGMEVKLKVLFYAISKYCISRECYSVTDELKLFVRICRNLIESIYQFNGGDVRCDTNIRLTNWNNYKRAIDRIVSNIVDGKVWFDNVNEKDFGDVEHERDKIDFDECHRSFIERWEDNEMFKGCLRAVLPSINNNSAKDINAALMAYDQTCDIKEVQLLIAFDYGGYNVGWCAYGQRLFFGKEGKWDVVFRRDWENVKEPFAKYVSAFKNCNDIKTLIENERNKCNRDSFKYYALNYPEFVQGNEETHYFAVKGELNDLDMISIEFSPKPLNKYHCDPFAYVVCKNIDKEIKQLKCWRRYSEKSSVYIHYSQDEQSDYFVELYSHKKGWEIRKWDDKNTEYLPNLYDELVKKGLELGLYEELEQQDKESKFILLKENEKDLIKIGERATKVCLEWINKTFNNKEERDDSAG